MNSKETQLHKEHSTALNLESLTTRSIVLVGLGPHAKRIYMHYFNKYGITPKIIIELESKREEVEAYLNQHQLSVRTLFVQDDYKNAEELPIEAKQELLMLIKKLNITHAIISTEPKAHFSYSRFFMKHNINTLIDKPITSPINVSNEPMMAKKIETDFQYLLGLYQEMDQMCQIQCQRRWHPGYEFIRDTLQKVVNEFGIPITSMEVYHCDGMWNMPDEFIYRENHPYKYGYGKLFHSGYHFIDLACWLLSVNKDLPNKQANNVEMYAAPMYPLDFMHVINQQDYKRLFNSDKLDTLFEKKSHLGFENHGEIDFYSQMQFKEGDNPITTVTLNLLQNGFTRRSWMDLPEDTYKGNGRVRHERINIQIGPLINIQVHSYQSKEIKERADEDNTHDVGSLEHFDIHIFRNVDLIGGMPYQKISLNDLANVDESGKFIGYNEQARESCLVEFLTGQGCTSEITDHATTIKVLSNAYLSLCNRKVNENPIIHFEI